MRATIVVPVKPFGEAKTRLAGVLAPDDRERLSRLFFRHVLGVVAGLHGIARCIIVSRSIEALDLARAAGASALVEIGSGLNAALDQSFLVARQDHGMLALSADLPWLTSDDVTAMLSEGAADIRIAVDGADKGTNALFMSRPGLIKPRFGTGSYVAHQKASANAGLKCDVIRRPGLASDIDTPADLLLLAADQSGVARECSAIAKSGHKTFG